MVEHHLDMVVVGGSIPLAPTNYSCEKLPLWELFCLTDSIPLHFRKKDVLGEVSDAKVLVAIRLVYNTAVFLARRRHSGPLETA